MTIHCACWRCTGKPWNDGTFHFGATHPTDVEAWNPDPLRPPDTDEEPWTIDVTHEITIDDEDRGLWLGALLLLVALVIGVLIGRLTA